MKHIHLSSMLVLTFFLLFMVYPLGYVLLGAFLVEGWPSLHYFSVVVGSEYFREVICNSLNLAIAVTALTSLIAYPIAYVMSRWKLPASGILHALLLLPLVVPPFVGVLGVRQLLGRFGTLNILLIDFEIISRPIEWLGSGNLAGIVALQVIHLVPVLYLSIGASLRNAHIALEEAAVMAGASKWQVIRRVVLPLSFPGWFAGAVVVFVASFTDLGTPLIFEYRHVLPVQIFNMLSDTNENPAGYSFVVFACVICVGLFYLAQESILRGSFSGTGRITRIGPAHEVPRSVAFVVTVLLVCYLTVAALPHFGVLMLSLAEDWFMSALPARWTLAHFYDVLAHPLTARSLVNSICLSLVASCLAVVVGYLSAYTMVRTRHWEKRPLEILTMLPLAVPGIVFAFGYIGAFSGTPLDSRINPFPLLIAAYIVRRTPNMVRSASAGLQEASPVLEDAALMVGAPPAIIARRIVFPLIRRHLAVGAILTFAYSMLEVSDGLLLALEERFYPVSKAMYALMGRPDGIELASALGVVLMAVMIAAFWLSNRLLAFPRSMRMTVTALALNALAGAAAVSAESRELVIVSPHWEGIRREFERGFGVRWNERTGETITFRWLDVGGTSDIIRYLRTQYRINPDGVGIDIMFGGGTDPFLELERSGNLEAIEVSPEILERIPREIAGLPLYSSQKRWFAAALATFGILYNKVAVEKLNLPVPSTWADLTAPEYAGLVGAGDPRKSGSMHAMYEIVLQGYGWDGGWNILQRMAGNVRNFSGGGSNVGKEIASGEIVYGLAIDTYASELIRRAGPERLGYVVPKDYATVNGDGIAVLRGAPQREAARAFIEYILSEEGQRLWYTSKGAPGGPVKYDLGKLPILPSLYGSVETGSVVKENPFEWKRVLSYDAETAGRRWALVNDLFGVFIIDVHDRLVGHLSSRAGQSTPIPAFPVKETAVAALLDGGRWSQDPALRSRTIEEWSDMARLSNPAESSIISKARWLPPLLFLILLAHGAVRRMITNRGQRAFRPDFPR